MSFESVYSSPAVEVLDSSSSIYCLLINVKLSMFGRLICSEGQGAEQMPEVFLLKATKFDIGVDLHCPGSRYAVLPSCCALIYMFIVHSLSQSRTNLQACTSASSRPLQADSPVHLRGT